MSRFTSHLGLVLVEDEQTGRPTKKAGRCLWYVATPLTYEVGAEGSGELITVPAGSMTDLASVPGFAWSLGFPPDGPWLKAAVIHDYLYATAGLNGRYTRKQSDQILREAMSVLGVGAWERFVIYNAVRVGGASGWSG